MKPLQGILLMLIAFLSFCNHMWRCKAGDRLRHIQVLEEYIQENHLPVPAYPLPKGKVAFEIKVPICQ